MKRYIREKDKSDFDQFKFNEPKNTVQVREFKQAVYRWFNDDINQELTITISFESEDPYLRMSELMTNIQLRLEKSWRNADIHQNKYLMWMIPVFLAKICPPDLLIVQRGSDLRSWTKSYLSLKPDL